VSRTEQQPEPTVFYDGACGFCHRSVRLIVKLDRGGRLRFAPLSGERFRSCVPEDSRAALPDSLVMYTAAGDLLVRSAGVIEIGRELGGPWRVLATLAGFVPERWLDRGYDWIARTRQRWFTRPEQACPLLPAALRQRFDLRP